jgi:hypothetical protein
MEIDYTFEVHVGIMGVSSHVERDLGWPDFSWQGECGVKTVSGSDVPMIIRDIQNQEEHQNELR